ncbi:ATP-binding protein [Candidatus Albibeggiatoa sp. nov. BB20]|uniref:ATP-binding protein n=1 Tax=Candidatus Albibeggiatoa sp. nov. BB20 TaxID=3162723 RepID=UPI00336546E2
MSLRWKLLIPTLLTSILLIAGMIYISLLQYNLYERQVEYSQFIHKAKVQTDLQQMAKDTQQVAHVLVEDWRMADGLLTENRDGLLELIQPFYTGLAFDWVTVYDKQAKVVVRADQPTWYDFPDALQKEVLSALDSTESITILTLLEEQLLLVSLEHLRPDIHGVDGLVAIGYIIDKTWLQHFLAAQLHAFDLQLFYSTWQLSVLDSESSQLNWYKFTITLNNIHSSFPLFGKIHETTPQDTTGSSLQIVLTVLLLLTISSIALFISHRLIRITVYSLQQAQDEANQAKHASEIANQAKSTFLASMSHELRTPLNGILGYAQILGFDDDLNEEQRSGLDIIQSSGEHLLMLINEVLDLSKIEAGKIELFSDDVHFDSFIRNVVNIFVLRAREKGIKFHYEPVSSIPNMIHVDEQRLRQVLINLLGNAIKFTDHGSVTLQIGYDSGGHLRFDVIDTGQGIDAANQAKVFNPFQQVGEHLKKTEGTGLGLAISQKIVAMMNGTLSVHSELGKGSTFTVCLNLPPISNINEAMLSQSDTQPIPNGYQMLGHNSTRDKYHILVVDDTPANRTLLKAFLKPLGFVVKTAENGQEGLELAQSWRPDLICTDIVMPVLDGLELTRLIRKQYPDLPIIALSASAFKADHDRAIAAGCNGFLPKPFYFIDLQIILSTNLDLKWTFAAECSN